MTYRARERHSEEELAHYEMLDLMVDIRCAYRDGLVEYAQECEQELLRKQAAAMERIGARLS